MIQVIIALVLPTILGFLLVSILLVSELSQGSSRSNQFSYSLLERICLGYPIGMGLLTMQMFLLGILRIPLTQFYATLPVVIEIILMSLMIWKKKIPLLNIKPNADDISANKAKIDYIRQAGIIILSIWTVLKIGSIFFETYLRPIWAWDAWANWSASAKIFYYSNSLLLDAPPDEFFGKNIVIRLISYPLNNHLMQVWLALWIGKFDDVLVKFWSPVYLLATTCYLYLFANKITTKLISLAIVVIFISSPLMSYHAIEVYSDLLLGSYLFFGLAAFANVVYGRHAYLPLIGIFSAIAMFTKDESIFFVMPLLISAFVFLAKNKLLKQHLAALLIPLVYAMPWYIFKFSNSLSLGAETIRFELVFHPEAILGVIFQFLSILNFNVVFVFFPILFLISSPKKEFLYLLIPILCYIGFFIMLYSLTSYYNDHFNRGTVFYRNVLTYYPSMMLLSSILINNLIKHPRMKA